jgi:glycosyltransferase involved in cell wall biosynthesis
MTASLTLRQWKYRLRARFTARQLASIPPPSQDLTLSVAIIAQDCKDQLRGLIENVRDVASEIVVVDGGSKDGSQEMCREEGPLVNLVERPWDGHFGRQKNVALDHCKGDWILHLDCDERIGPHLKERLPKLCLQEKIDFYRLPMYWLVTEEPLQYVLTKKHFPCWVPRLMRNLPEFRYQEKDPVHVTFPPAVKDRMAKSYGAHLFHYCLAWLSRAELEAKAERYRQEHPGTEDTTSAYYLYWKHDHLIRNCEEMP